MQQQKQMEESFLRDHRNFINDLNNSVNLLKNAEWHHLDKY